jgi:hypothetical protein
MPVTMALPKCYVLTFEPGSIALDSKKEDILADVVQTRI